MVVDKYGYGSFHNTLLEDALRAAGVRQVWVVGTVTQICVEETVREGFRRGFEMVVAADGVSSFDDELHRATLRNLAAKFALVVARPGGDRVATERGRRRWPVTRADDEPVDVLIIGAGASGGVVARRLAEAGIGVLCLEQGGWHDRREYRGAELDWELTARKQWSGSPNIRGLRRRLSRRRRRLGHLAADVRRRRRLDAAVRGRVAAPAAVGLPGAHARRCRRRLAAQLCRAPAVLRAQRPADRRVGSRRRPGLPARRGPAAAAAADRCRRAEGRQGPRPARLALVAGTQRDPLRALRRSQPVRAAGHVHAGLQRGREGLDRPHPLAAGDRQRRPVGDRRPGARLETNERGLVTGATWLDRDGREHFQAASTVVLAANGIGTPRLLLLSSSPRHPDGLANSTGLVGTD